MIQEIIDTLAASHPLHQRLEVLVLRAMLRTLYRRLPDLRARAGRDFIGIELDEFERMRYGYEHLKRNVRVRQDYAGTSVTMCGQAPGGGSCACRPSEPCFCPCHYRSQSL